MSAVEEVSQKIDETLTKKDVTKQLRRLDDFHLHGTNSIEYLSHADALLDDLPTQLTELTNDLEKTLKGHEEVQKELLKRQTVKKGALNDEINDLNRLISDLDSQINISQTQLATAEESLLETNKTRRKILENRKDIDDSQRLLYAILKAIPVNVDAIKRACEGSSAKAWEEIEFVINNLKNPPVPVEVKFPEVREWR